MISPFKNFLNVEKLNKISFDRSIKWSSFFTKYEKFNDTVEIPLDNLELYITDNGNVKEEEDDDSSASDDDVNKEIDIGAMLDATCRNIKSKAECTFQQVTENDGDNNENLQDVLNATLPILVEHKLQCKRAGIDRILNTFDTDTIERKVGDWLRQNNIIGMNSTVLSSKSHCVAPASKYNKLPCIESESDAESSLHSFDTARYIKASKSGRHSSGRLPSAVCDPRTIRTYRTSQSKRDALREKYATDEFDREELFVNELRRRHNHFRAQIKRDDFEMPTLQDKRCLSIPRRKYSHKQLIQRHNLLSSFSNDSSSCESDELVCKYRNTSRRSHHMRGIREDKRCRSLAYVRRLHRQRLNHSLSSSSSFVSIQNVNKAQSRRQQEIRLHDCWSEIKLKNDTNEMSLHTKLVKTSDILEEKPSSRKTKNARPTGRTATKHKMEVQKNVADNAINVLKEKPSNRITNSTRKTATKNKRNVQQNVADNAMPLNDSLFEEHLKIAIQMSKELELNELNKKVEERNEDTKQCDLNELTDDTSNQEYDQNVESMDKNGIACTETLQQSSESMKTNKIKRKSTTTVKKIKNKRKKETNNEQKLLCEPTITDVDQKTVRNNKMINAVPDQSRIQLSEQSHSKNLLEKKTDLTTIHELSSDCSENNSTIVNCDAAKEDYIVNDELTPEFKLKPQPKSAKLRKLQKLSARRQAVSSDVTHSAFTSTTSNSFCNSTALSNDSVKTRQNLDCTATSTRNPEHFKGRQLLLNKNGESINESIEKDEDCALVSSTIADQQPESQGSVPSNRERILVYTPTARHMLPESSIHNDRYHITKEHLANVIGERFAQKFLKYYVGRREFDSESTVYYRPPINGIGALEFSDDSDVDALDLIDQCGNLCESFKKT